MKKLLSWIAVMAMLLGLATVAGATGSTDPAAWDASIFEIPEDLYVFHDDPADQDRYDYLGVECWEPIGLGIYHYVKGGVNFYRWLDKMEKIPAVTEENGGCFVPPMKPPATVVFWDGVPNLSKDMFKWAEGTTKDVYIPDSVTEIDEDAFVMNSTITLHFTANNEVALAYAQNRGMAYKIVPRKHYDASIFVEPENLYEAGYDGIECMDIDLGLYHLIPARNGGVGSYFRWTGTMEKMPANAEENECCFTSATSASETVIFWDGVPNFSKDLFKWWEGTTKDVYIPDSVTEIDEDAFVMNSTITLHFTANNAVALAYAQSRGMLYEILPDAPEPDASDPDVSDPEGSSDKVVLDTSIFFVEPEMVAECACPELLGLSHMAKDGIIFFGGHERLPEGSGFCGTPDDPWRETVVFLDGVPNLVNDLFKYWENGTNDVYIPDSVTEIAENCFVEGSHITLHFTANNPVALAYAQARGMAFEVMDGQRMPGDVNFDKSVDMKDTLSLRKSIANLPAAFEIYSLDVNGDDSTDMKDVLTLRKQIAQADA